MEQYKTIQENKQIELIERKSKFIANIYYIENEEQAKRQINTLKKKYYDARHNCYAYRILNEENTIIEKNGDDGEPCGTAGSPILNVIKKNDLVNVLIVVTRYFGGILLGIGGLTRSYSDSAKLIIQTNEIISITKGYEMKILIQYSEFDTFRAYLKKRNIKVVHVEYDNNVTCTVEISKMEKGELFGNVSNQNWKVLNSEIIKEKYVQIQL